MGGQTVPERETERKREEREEERRGIDRKQGTKPTYTLVELAKSAGHRASNRKGKTATRLELHRQRLKLLIHRQSEKRDAAKPGVY